MAAHLAVTAPVLTSGVRVPARQADAPLQDGFPPSSHVLDYLTAYETHCDLPVERPVRMSAVRHDSRDLVVESGNGQWRARRGISAIGTWQRPFWPIYPGAHTLTGRQLHTVDYRTPPNPPSVTTSASSARQEWSNPNAEG